MALSAGDRLGPYEILALIGKGGMGEVYRATDTRLHRSVAIKILPQDKIADPARRRRFLQEARAASALNHPNIVTLHDIASEDGVDYLVMEYVPGKSLNNLIPPNGLSLAEAVSYGTQIAGALAAAASAGIVHRDIKPGNIIVTPDGRVKVLDFGLARLEEPILGPDDETRTMHSRLTEAGVAMGTPAYMAPEQKAGKPGDARTDIYSFGRVLYEMLTGSRDLSLHKRIPSRRLEKIVHRCLEEDPQQRWRSADALQQELKGVSSDRGRKLVVAAAAATLALTAGGYLYLHLHPAPGITDKDTIVLADFVNDTGDPVFDGTLRQGLAIQLEQSPFLSLISDEAIQKTLALMGNIGDVRLSPKVAREICERTGSAAVLEGSIATLGSKYVLGLRAKNCRTGVVLDEEQVQAARKEDVLDVLSQIALRFRTKVGESLATVKQHAAPLEEATTTSLEALKAYSAGSRHLRSDSDVAAGVPLFQRAIEIDPKFALAYAALGFSYGLLSQPGLSAESNRKAYELRDRTTDRERFYITATYETQVTGNLEKALQTCELWMQTYPRENYPHGILGAFIYPTFGKYEKGVEVAKQMVAADPDFPVGYLQLAFNNQFASHLGEAEKALQQASTRKLEAPELAVQRYDLAFLKGDQAGMDREVTLAQSAADDLVLDREGFVLAYSGHLKEAKLMAQRAEDLNQASNQRGKKALFEIGPALWDAFFGNSQTAKKKAEEAVDLAMDRDVEYGAAVALALSGESSRSQALAKDLETRFPEDTALISFYRPAIRALLELDGGRPSKALDLLQVSRPYDLGIPPSLAPAFIGPLFTVYVRGLAYLAAHQGPEAAAEFQKILDARNIVVSDPIGALAHLQLGRAFALSGDTTRAKTAYQDFLTLWKDADADIPILTQAKSQYARLR